MRRYCNTRKPVIPTPTKFAASQSGESVTKMCATMKSEDGKFIVIDIPGTNDPGGDATRRLTNEVISKMFVETLERKFIYDSSTHGELDESAEKPEDREKDI